MAEISNSFAETKEEWHSLEKILALPNYAVSSWGNVSRVNIASGQLMHYIKPSVNNGYHFVMLSERFYVHRLVALAFLGAPPSDNHTVDHIDRNPLNNRVSNLRWATWNDQMLNRKSWTHKRPIFQFIADGSGKFMQHESIEDIKDFDRKSVESACEVNGLFSGFHWCYCDSVRLLGEEHKPITEFPDYEATNKGRIFSKVTNRYLNGSRDENGYVFVKPSGSNQKVHRLIAVTFLGDIKDKHVDHKNGIRHDNRVENLQIVTAKENCQLKEERRREAKKPAPRSKPVIQYREEFVNGQAKLIEIAKFPSAVEAAKSVGRSNKTISHSCTGSGGLTCAGFVWRYA